MIPPIGPELTGVLDAGAGGALALRAVFLFARFAFTAFFFRAGAARFAAFLLFFAFAFFRFFAIVIVLPEWVQPATQTTGETAGVPFRQDLASPSRP